MRLTSLFACVLLAALTLLGSEQTAHAQTWNKVCVNGGATGGAHNGTWQKVNTAGTGGNTWKKLGGCMPPPPPPPPANPFPGTTFASEPWGVNPFHNKGEGHSRLDVKADGSWVGTGAPHFSDRMGKPTSGRWAYGASGSDFEVSWIFVSALNAPDDFFAYNGVIYELTYSSPQNVWTPMDNGWWIKFRAWDGNCYPEETAVAVIVDVTIRLKTNHSVSRKDRVAMWAHGYNGLNCG